tara:strand:- start:181 stop:330 length:150 start_codon:yes stop_codon:yes gene_type:complete
MSTEKRIEMLEEQMPFYSEFFNRMVLDLIDKMRQEQAATRQIEEQFCNL